MFPQNQWPNFTNFPYPSFPQPVTPPDNDPDTGDMICVTYSRSWTAVLLSAVNQLIQLSTWAGTDDQKKLAAQRATNLQWQLQNDIGCEMKCCYDTVSHRVTSDGSLEISINGGGWIPDPNDPRIEATQYPPIVIDETHTKCDAAINASVHIQNIISETSSQLGGTGSILEVAAAIVAAIFALFIAPETLPALAPVILPLIAGLLFVGQAAWDAYFDDTVDEIILCALFCNISDDGAFTQEQYDAFIAKLTSDMPASPAKDMFISLVSRVGLIGLNDYAAIGTSADGDCSDCDCETGCDLSDWTPAAGYAAITTGNDGTYNYIEQDAVDIGGGTWAAAAVSPDVNQCCVIRSITVLSGSTSNSYDFLCGVTPRTLHGGAGSGDCISGYYIEATNPFRIRYTFENTEDCT